MEVNCRKQSQLNRFVNVIVEPRHTTQTPIAFNKRERKHAMAFVKHTGSADDH